MALRYKKVIFDTPSASQTVNTTTTTAQNVEEFTQGRMYVYTTAIGSSGTIDITVQSSSDASNWVTLAAHSQITANGNTTVALTNMGKYIRLSKVVGVAASTYQVDIVVET